MKQLFTRRQTCPICDFGDYRILCRLNQTDPVYRRFLEIEPTFRRSFWDDVARGLLNDQLFEVVKCRACGLIFQTTILSDAGMSKLYSSWIDAEALAEYRAKTQLGLVAQGHRGLLDLVGVYGNSTARRLRLLDFGAGTGEFCRIAQSKGFDVCALELSNERKKELSQRGIPVITPADLQPESFDAVFLNQVVEHLSRPREVLAFVHKILKSNGILWVAVPNCRTVERLLKNHEFTTDTHKQVCIQHVNCFINKTLRDLLNRSGFRIITDPRAYLKLACSRNPLRIAKCLLRPYKRYLTATNFFCRKVG